jgi:hypothetical protein
MPDRPSPAVDVDQSDDRLSLFLRITGALRAAAAQGPVILILDDFHWADPATTSLMSHIVTTMALETGSNPVRLAVILSVRPNVETAHVASALDRYGREQLTRKIRLSGLGQAELHDLITNETGTRPSRSLVRDMAVSTEGNPLHALWLLQRLDAFGALTTRRGVLVNASSAELAGLPSGLDAVLRARSESMTVGCQRLLTAAAFLGDSIALDDLQLVSGLADDQFARFLDEASDGGLLFEDDTDRYQFAHPQLRQLLYHGPQGRRRRQLHRLMADRLDGEHGVDDGYAAQIAFHQRMAGADGDPDRLVRAALIAAAEAAGVGAWSEAFGHLEAVLAATAETSSFPSGFLALVHYRASIAAWWDHDNLSAKQHADEAVRHARALGDLERWGLAAANAERAARLATTALLGRGTTPDLEPLLAFLDAAGDKFPGVRARVLANLCQSYIDAGHLDLARPHAEDALVLATELDDEHVTRLVEREVAWLHAVAVELGQAKHWYQRCLHHVSNDDPLSTVWIHNRYGLTCWMMGELDEAEAHLLEGGERARSIGAWFELCSSFAWRSAVAVARGDHDVAEMLAAEADRLRGFTDNAYAAMTMLPALACSRADRGEASSARAALRALAETVGFASRRLEIAVSVRLGELETARQQMADRRLRVPDPEQEVRMFDLGTFVTIAEIAAGLTDNALSEAIQPQLEALVGRGVEHSTDWPLSLTAALEAVQGVLSAN